jgi:hypothetical protein
LKVKLKSDLSAHIKIKIEYINESNEKADVNDTLFLNFEGKVKDVTVDNKKYHVYNNTKKVVVPTIQLDSGKSYTRVVEYNIEGFVKKYGDHHNINHILSFTGDKPNYIELKYSLPTRKGRIFKKTSYRMIKCEKSEVVIEYKEKENVVIYNDYLYDKPYIQIPFMYEELSFFKHTIYPAIIFGVVYLTLLFLIVKYFTKNDGSLNIGGALILGIISSMVATNLIYIITEKYLKIIGRI